MMKRPSNLLNHPLVPTVTLALTLFASEIFANDHAPPAGLAPRESYQALLEGNRRYTTGGMKHANQDNVRRHELISGQKPHAIVLSCSDSRVPPELIFDQGLGEIFVVRVAGNVLGTSTVASIEYAVEHLGSRLIVVLGHESCGAVKAALATPPNGTAGSGDLDGLVAAIQPNLETFNRSIASEDPTVRRPVMSNVDGVTRQLVKRSHILRRAVSEGRVAVVKGIYSLESGKVEYWDVPFVDPAPEKSAGKVTQAAPASSDAHH